ncbi:GroES-like protein [Coprinopsis marcescibilis]|uniref:GroES-like protein n=1 Tax=Coprinopsis marcescibilis TaxID=230819 RepID=A0A5C3L590_COPMA|nr:GroES-like protein [Coprinopsis marcescibilis]
MPTQKAVVLEKKLGSFQVKDVARPSKPAKDEILVKVDAVGLNPVDWKVRKFGIYIDNYPVVLGTDIAGEVVELGENVTKFAKGDKVFFQGRLTDDNELSGFQQFAKADALTTAKIPPNLTSAQAASIPVAFTAAYVGLYAASPNGAGFEPPTTSSSKGKYTGTPIVILGGSSSVGQYVIQLAHLSGFSPIIATSSLKHGQFLKSLGATDILDRSITPAEIQAAVEQRVGDSSVKLVYDAISLADTQHLGLQLLAPGGQLAIVLLPAVEPKDDKAIIGVVVLKTLPYYVRLLRDLYANSLTGWLEDGSIKPNRVETLPNGLDGIMEGLKRLEEDKVSGAKLVALPQETA